MPKTTSTWYFQTHDISRAVLDSSPRVLESLNRLGRYEFGLVAEKSMAGCFY